MTRAIQIAILAISAAPLAVAQYGAMPQLDVGLSPRSFLASEPYMVKRQSIGCLVNQHSCQDINAPGACCADDHYCTVDENGNPKCCAIGNLCYLNCSIDKYQCAQTATISGTVTTTIACCTRACTATLAFQCVPSLGGGCCSLGSACMTSATNFLCQPTSTTTQITTLVSQIQSGCSPGQFRCASSIGGGCCANGAECVQSGTAAFCSTPAPTTSAQNPALNTSLTEVPASGGLSTGAKAGIGAGVAVLACLVIGFGIWFCMKRRKEARRSPVGSDTVSAIGDTSQTGGARTGSRPTGAGDYYGPDAVAGPFTGDVVHSPTGFTPARGVPLAPDNPADIVPAVEIGNSKEHSNVTSPGEVGSKERSNVTSPGDFGADGEYFETKVPETAEHRFELP